MKKICLLLVGLLVLFSCEKEDLDGIMNIDTGQTLTRASTSIANFDPISELNGIPVNILNVGNASRKYLSCTRSGGEVDLYTKDDESLRQRWYLRSGNIVLAGGVSFVMPNSTALLLGANPKDESVPSLIEVSSFFMPNLDLNSKGRYYIIGGMKFGALMTPNNLYLQSTSKTGSQLRYKSNNSTDLAQWEFVPVGEFRLVDMQYEKSVNSGDFINRKDISIDGAVFPALPYEVEHSMTVSRTIRHTSTFTETTGVTTQNQSSFHLGIQAGSTSLPMITAGGDISNSTTSSHSVSYTDTDGYDETVSQSFKCVIPANTACTVEILKMAYQTSVTYVATFQKVDGADAGKKFRIKGRWDGVVTTLLYYNVYRNEDMKLIETRVIGN